MTTIAWLHPEQSPDALPSPDNALREPNGLLAAGGSLNRDWLLHGYRHGIFPWYESGQPILWWSPDPRAIVLPDAIRVSRSLRRKLRSTSLQVTCDMAFDAVVAGCAAPRNYTSQTWITADMAAAYGALHREGWAHSFEAWHDDRLVGGLYGVAIGQVFFGESMFTRETDASKIAFVHSARFLATAGFELIDCQLPSAHLESLGATTLPRAQFLRRLEQLTDPPGSPAGWTRPFTDYLAARHHA